MKHLFDFTPPGRWLADVGHPLLVAIAVCAIPVFSNVAPNLLVVKGLEAEVIMITYGLLLLSLIIKPEQSETRHAIGAALAVLAFVGRGGGFLELVLGDPPRIDLTAAVTERLPLATAQILWHLNRKVTHNG